MNRHWWSRLWLPLLCIAALILAMVAAQFFLGRLPWMG